MASAYDVPTLVRNGCDCSGMIFQRRTRVSATGAVATMRYYGSVGHIGILLKEADAGAQLEVSRHQIISLLSFARTVPPYSWETCDSDLSSVIRVLSGLRLQPPGYRDGVSGCGTTTSIASEPLPALRMVDHTIR